MKRLLTALVCLACTACTACSGPQSVLDPAGDQAARLFSLWSLMLWVCGAAYLLVMVFLGWAIWRSRRQLAGAPEPNPHDPGLRRGLAAWALLIFIGLAVLIGASFLVDRSFARDAAGSPTVRVTGQQWWWRIQYRLPSGVWIETANELHLPVNRPTRVEILSSDVIHSFWIPNLSGKIDMIPGRANAITLTPRRLGWVRGQCAEFCGLQHAQMALDVKVESDADYAAWLARQAAPASPPKGDEATLGYRLVTSGVCSNCHTIRGAPAVARAGPDLTHVASRRTLAAGTLPMGRGAIMGWIAQPQALKPGAQMPPTSLSGSDANAVAAYLEGLT